MISSYIVQNQVIRELVRIGFVEERSKYVLSNRWLEFIFNLYSDIDMKNDFDSSIITIKIRHPYKYNHILREKFIPILKERQMIIKDHGLFFEKELTFDGANGWNIQCGKLQEIPSIFESLSSIIIQDLKGYGIKTDNTERCAIEFVDR